MGCENAEAGTIPRQHGGAAQVLSSPLARYLIAVPRLPPIFLNYQLMEGFSRVPNGRDTLPGLPADVTAVPASQIVSIRDFCRHNHRNSLQAGSSPCNSRV